MSRSSATSVAFQRSTSQRMSTARCRGGRCCSAATNASRTDSRASATSAGSPSATRGCRASARSRAGRASAGSRRSAPRKARDPSAAPAACGCRACRSRRSSRCGRARSETRRGPRSGRCPPRANERLLDGVLGVDRAEHAVAVGRQLDAVLLELLLEGERGRGHRVTLANPSEAMPGTAPIAPRRVGVTRPSLPPRFPDRALVGRNPLRTAGTP